MGRTLLLPRERRVGMGGRGGLGRDWALFVCLSCGHTISGPQAVVRACGCVIEGGVGGSCTGGARGARQGGPGES